MQHTSSSTEEHVPTADSARTGRRFGALMIVAVLLVAASAVLLVFRALGPGSASAHEAAAPKLRADAVADALSRARKMLAEQQPAQAEALLASTIALAPADQDLRTLHAETLMAAGRMREAYDEYVRAIAIGPSHAELEFAAGTVASAAGLYDQAEEHYSAAQIAAPTNPKHPLYLAQIQRRLGRIEEAKASLLRAANLDPSLAIAWGVLADIALGENSLSIASTHIRRAREAEPSNVQWKIIESRIARRENDPERSLRLLMALDESKRLADPMVLREAALAYGMLGRPADAAELYAAAVELRPDDADLLYEAAQWHERAGQRDVAIVYASRAARQGSEPGERLLRELEAGAGG